MFVAVSRNKYENYFNYVLHKCRLDIGIWHRLSFFMKFTIVRAGSGHNSCIVYEVTWSRL